MKKRLAVALFIFLMFVAAAVPAMAADVFRFAAEPVVYVGYSAEPELLREGKFAEGTVTYSIKGNAGTIDENGTITGVAPGQLTLTAELTQDGKVVKRVQTRVTVCRKVTNVTLNTNGLQVYEPDDEKIAFLLDPDADGGPATDMVLVLPVGKKFWPRATVLPEDVANAHKKVTFETSDNSILTFSREGQFIASKPGECTLTVRSNQSPEVTEQYHVLVTQPVKKVVITAGAKNVAVGKTLQLGTEITPKDATIQEVTWNSRNQKVATVDEYGVVTGIARGDVVIEAKTTDGTNLTATYYMNVTQDVTEITIREEEVTVATRKSAPQLHAQALPQNASNRKVTWTSSDESIATVNAYGTITGKKAGECYVTCSSVSNPDVTASIPVHVIQLVTDIQYVTPAGMSFYIGESRQLEWTVLPEDASIQDVTFKSRAPKVAAVDQNGIVTGVAKGQADIEVRATDGSNKYRVYRVTILKAVQGINPMSPQYYAQVYGTTNIKATVYPNDASDQAILWSSNDESVASIRSVGTSYGRIYGQRPGYATITATTHDGGYSTTTNVVVDDFNGMVACDSAYIDADNKIRVSFRNKSWYYTVDAVYFRVDCYDTQGNPIVCTADGGTSFNGTYPLTLEPGGYTLHGRFNFNNYRETGLYGYVTVTVTGYAFDNGQKWWIPEDQQITFPSTNSIHWGEPTPAPAGDPEESNG